jgi:hypothetical protein
MKGSRTSRGLRIEDSKLDLTVTPCLGKLPIPSVNNITDHFDDSIAGEELFQEL